MRTLTGYCKLVPSSALASHNVNNVHAKVSLQWLTGSLVPWLQVMDDDHTSSYKCSE